MATRAAERAGCRDLRIQRYDLAGKRGATFDMALADAHPGCQLTSVRGYDRARIPYVDAQCAPTAPDAKCLLVAARSEGLFIHAVGNDRPWKDCSGFPGARLSLRKPEEFVALE